MITTADLQKALFTVWGLSGLDAVFTALWESTVVATNFLVLNEQEAAAGQPFPYCVLETGNPRTIGRDSGTKEGELRETRSVSITLNVHVNRRSGSLSMKQVAAGLVEEIMKVFGGHPKEKATGIITLENGAHLQTQYQTDYPVRRQSDYCQWVLQYEMLLDVPVAV